MRGSDGKPPRSGDVTLVDQRRLVELGPDGEFEFDRLIPGTYLMIITTPTQGHNVLSVEVWAGETTAVKVDLHITSHNEEVVVSAVGNARSALEMATPVTVLTGEELLLRSRGSLGQTLADEVGVSETSFAGGASRPVIRGLEGDRIRILQDGLATGDAAGVSPDHSVSLDPGSAESIEIIRGPGSLLYGSSAIGGVVNVEDRVIPRYRLTQPLAGHADLWAGSVDQQRGTTVALEGGASDFAWHLEMARRQADDYTIAGPAEIDVPTGGGSRPLANSDFETSSASLGGSWFLGDAGYVGLSVSGFETEYGLPAAVEDDSGTSGDGSEGEQIRIDMDRNRLDLRGELNQEFGPFRGVRGRVAVVDYHHDELENGAVGTTFLRDSAEGRFEFVQRPQGRLAGSIGLQLAHDALDTFGEEAFIPSSDTTDMSVFAFEELTWDRWSLQLGGRLDQRDINPTAAALLDRSFTAFSTSIGAIYEASDATAVGVSLARSTKLPNSQELYADGPHLAVQAFEIGNPDLANETSLGIDAFLRQKVGRVAGELTLFAQDFDGFIFPDFTGEVRDGLPVVVYGHTDARFVGFELDLAISVWSSSRKHFDVKVFGDHVRAEQRITNEPLPRIPPLGFGTSLHYHGERFHLMGEVRHRQSQTDTAPGETPTSGYTLVNASYSYRFLLRNQILDLVVRGRNLNDVLARNHVSFVKDTVPLAGRDLGLLVRLQF